MDDTQKPPSYPSDDQLEMAIAQGRDLTKPKVAFQLCPVCHAAAVVRMPDDWQAQVELGAVIPIVACGNPWHYANMPTEPA